MKKTSPNGSVTAKKHKVEQNSNLSYHTINAQAANQDLFNLTTDLIQIFKPDGAFLDVNLSWKRALLYNDEDLAHLTVFNLLRPQDKKECEEVFNVVFKDGKTRKSFVVLLTKKGDEVIVEGTIGVLLGEDGKPCALRGVFQDVTRYKKYEDLKNEFVSTVSHELRTPLTVIREGVEQMRDNLVGSLTAEQHSLLDMILRNADRLTKLVVELLDVSRLEAGKVQIRRSLCNVVDLAKAVVENFKIIAQQKKLELLVESEKERIDIHIDREKIMQVLTNFVGNALKFTARGSVKIKLFDREDFLECCVADTGRGISKEDLPNLFEKFRQFERGAGAGSKGTGLGLAISKKLVELHQGRVSIESVPMQGTTVTFLLPKYTYREIFINSIKQTMDKCLAEGRILSVLVFDIVDYNVIKEKLGEMQAAGIVEKMEEILNKTLRRAADVAIKDTRSILVLLPDTKKENAYIAMGRLYQALEEYLKSEEISDIEIRGSVTCFPEEADTIEKMLDRICE